jgi:hypothetical protein
MNKMRKLKIRKFWKEMGRKDKVKYSEEDIGDSR